MCGTVCLTCFKIVCFLAQVVFSRGSDMKRQVLGFFAALASVFAMVGCDVGLGEVVDTQAPALAISYPPLNATIRDSFILYGTWSDDKGVSSVSVKVVNTETKETVDSLSATVSSDKTWQVSLNEFDSETGYKYKDGTYQVSITAYDGAGHSSGESSRTFDIDNTAPVFIISNPGVVKSDNLEASAYGSVFTIDGTIADDHTISLMDVAIYDASGSLVSHETYDSEQIDFFREEEISTAGGTSVTIAQYADSPSTTANTRYSDVYGTDSSAGTKYYYASVTLTDSAQIYQNPTGSERSAADVKTDSLGNSTSKVYLYDDVYTSLMSAKKGLGLSAADLKNILNGTVSNDSALSVLNESVKDTASSEDSRLYFSLNPEANPTYTISGYTFGFGDGDTIQSASNGNTVNVTINSGLDGVKVDPATLKLWMYTCEGSGKPTETDIAEKISSLVSKVKIAEASAESDGDATITESQIAEIAEDGWTLVYDYYTYNGSSVDVKSIAMTLPSSGIVLNKYYILAATGYDADDVPFSQKTIYGFAGNVSGIAPTIEILTPENGAFVKADELEFTGTALVNNDSLHVSTLKATIYAWNGSSAVGDEDGYAVTLTYDSASEKWTSTNSDAFGISGKDWTFKPSAIDGFLAATENATKYTLSIYGESSSGHSITMSSMVQLDTTAPVVSITTVTPTVSGADVSDVVKASNGYDESNVYINGTVRIMGSIVEQNIASVKYDILASEDLDADFSEKKEDGTYKYSILDKMYEATKDNPNIPAPYDGDLGASNSIDVSFMTSMVTQGMITGGAITEDTPIKIRVVFTATDEVGNTGTYSSDEYNDGNDFIIYQETDRPKIEFGNADDTVSDESGINSETNLFGTTSNNKLSLSFDDDDSVAKYEVYLYKSDGTTLAAVNDVYGGANPYSLSPNKTTASLNYLLPETEGVYKVKVIAQDSGYGDSTFSDAFRNIEVGTFCIAVDSGAPTLSVDSVAAYVSTSDSITGTVSPSSKSFDNETEISAVFLDSELNELSSQPATLTATTDGQKWTFPLSSLSATASGTYILKITATDKYSQKSSTNVTFSMDPIAPTITEPTSEQTVKLDESSYVTLNVVVSDDTDGSGLSTVGYYLSDVNTAPSSYDGVSWTAMNQTNTDWRTTFDISSVKNEDGILYAFFGAKDNAGNTQVSTSSIKLTIDKTAPSITVTGFDGSEVASNGTSKTTDSALTFTVKALDTNISSLSSGDTSVTLGSEASIDGGKSYTATVSWNTDANGNVEDSKTVTFTATDANGRTATKTITVACDNSAPVLTLNDYNEYASSSVELSGTVTDTNFTASSSNLKLYLVPADSSKETKSGVVTFGSTSDSKTEWTATFTGLEETSYNIVAVSKDSFGNSSAYRTGSVAVPSDAGFTGDAIAFAGEAFKVDVNAPELTENSVKIGTSSENASQTENFYYNGKSASIYISGAATDSSSGIESVVILPYSKTSADGIEAAFDSSTGTFSATVPNEKITKSGTIYAKITDKAGNSNDVNLAAVTYDATAPKIQSYALSDNKSGYTAYNSGKDSSGNAVYYVNNSTGHTFTLSGIATDNLGLASAVLSIGSVTKEITDEDSLSSYSFTEIDLTSLSGETTAKITLTDKAGNTAEQEFTVKPDTASPSGVHETDSDGKDYTFRLGSGSGGKYSAGTYGNASTIQIRGYFNETGSGTNMIYYKLFSGSAPTAENAETFLSSYENEADGYFSPLSSEETAEVSSTADNTTKTVTTNFKSNITGFQEGKNYLLLVAVDNVGNAALDTVTYEYTDTSSQTVSVTGCYSINVDTTTPVFDKESESILTNGEGEGDNANIVIEGYVTDAAAGIDSVAVSVTVGTSTASATVETEAAATDDDANRIKWTATLAKSAFANVTSGTYTVYAKATDKAGEGNSQTVAVANVTVDKIAPTVTLNNPSDADSSTNNIIEINGTISLSGTITDANTLPDIAISGIEYSTDNSSWNDLASVEGMNLTLTGNYSFTVSGFDTTKLTDEKTYYIRAKALDKAGNYGYSEVATVKVSQDTDRPQVKINNLTANGSSYILKYGTNAQVTGTITDDDSASTAVISKLIISETAYTGTGDEPTNLVSFTASTGDFTFTPSNTEDGTKTFYIYIEDNAGGKFYTTATAENYLSNPKISVKGTAAAETVNSSTFTYSSDGTNPVVNLGEGLPYASTTGSVAKDDSGNDFALTTDDKQTTNATLNSSFKVGGTSRRYVKFYFTASDASGVAGMTVVFKNESGAELAKFATAATVGDVDMSDFTVSENSTFTSSSDGTSEAKWTTDFIDLSEFGTGQISVAVTPYDNAGLSGNGAFSFYVDNTAPSIEIRSPSSGTEVTGSVSISGSANDTGAAGTSNIQWIVPTTTQTTTFKAKTSDAEKLAYLQSLSLNGGASSLAAEATVTSWQFDFDGQYDAESSDSDNFVFSAGNPLFNVYDKADFATNDDYASTGLYYLPVYFLATDALGNASYSTGFYIKHNPDADRPKLEFTYPTKTNYKSDSEQYAVLGGTIRATGSAEIPSGTTTVGAIYYQIADEDGAFDSDDMAQATTYGYTVVRAWDAINAVKGTSFTSETTLTDKQLEDFGFASNEAFQAWWGVKANGTASWNLVLNSSGELNPSDDSSTTNITLRACGINADGKMGAWTSGDNVIAIHVDNTAPVISGVINQYSNGTAALTAVPTSAYTSSQTYEADMYLRGCWTLVATVVDETEVKSYSVLKGSTALTEGSGYFVESGVTDSSTGKNGYRLYIPIPKDSGSVEITINASDNDHDSSSTYSFNIDETAPTLDKLTGNGTSFESDDFESIEDDNYQFILAGSSTDEGSGVENILFYYMRKNGTTGSITDEVVMDPMITSSTADAKVAMSDLTARTFKQGSDEFTLYAKEYTGTATTETFTSDSAYDAHVRIGGVVEIDGILHTISAISGNTVTFSPSLSAAKTSFTAYFPIAQVIDNSATEKVKSYSANPFTFEKGDDGDKMPESFSKSGKTWTWDATIHSTNMPDGPASLVILAFDSAGNVAGKTINTKITNNAPRLAKVFLGTDLSGDGKYVNSSSLTEIVEYDILGAEGATQKAYTLDFTEKQSDGTTAKYSAGTFKIKNGLAVIPELTGGNGDIGMVLNTSATSATAVTGTVTDAASSNSESADSDGNISASFTGTVAGTFKGSNASYKMHAFTVASGDLGDDGTDKGMSFTFWDSTEETTRGTDSQFSVLYVKNFTVAQSDTTKPTVVVNPFYWNSSDDNSLYGNSSDNGHIELEADLTDAITSKYGDDPKVSGKITFTGTAYDEHRLASLAVQFGTFLDSETTVATYNASAGSWTVESKTMDSDGYEFTVKDATSSDVGNYGDSVYFDQKGHKVYWTLSIDSSKITTVAATDVKVTVTATDASDNATDTSSITAPVTTSDYTVTDGTTNYPVYQMDVVPYITGVTTTLSNLKKNNPSVYNRTSRGHYPVAADETITFSGFNLGDTTTLDVSTLSASGAYDFAVSGISALNNLNDNDAKGVYDKTVDLTTSPTGSKSIYDNYYNRCPNGDNNNLLTDDVVLDVWQITKDAVKPKAGTATNPVMSINPKTHDVGFAFVNGTLYFSMPNGNTYSYDYWIGGFDVWTSIGLAYDKYGNSYATAAGGDINAEKADQFRVMTSRWGHGKLKTDGYNDGTNQFRLELIGQRDFEGSGTSYTGYNNFDKERIQSPTMATTASSSDKTTLYMAYYDAINDEIRFKWGYFTDTSKADASSGLMGDYYGFGSIVNEKKLDSNYGIYRTAYNSLLAGQTERVVKTNGTTTSAKVVTTDNQPVYAGKYVSIAAIEGGGTSDDAVVAVWWDGTNNQLLYSYNKTPKSITAGMFTQADTKWSTPVTVFDAGIGEYCKVVTDAAGGVHIAAYDGSNGDVWYAYLDDFDTPSNMKTCLVDSYGIIGTRLNIDVALNSSNKPIPYISYYSSSRPKIARWSDSVSLTSSSLTNGATDDQFTGSWEVSYVPTSSKFSDSNIGVGVWKDENGVLNYSTTDGKTPSTDNIGTNTYQPGQSETTESYGTVWGNGSKNAILGYATTSGASGYIETAQMK